MNIKYVRHRLYAVFDAGVASSTRAFRSYTVSPALSYFSIFSYCRRVLRQANERTVFRIFFWNASKYPLLAMRLVWWKPATMTKFKQRRAKTNQIVLKCQHPLSLVATAPFTPFTIANHFFWARTPSIFLKNTKSSQKTQLCDASSSSTVSQKQKRAFVFKLFLCNPFARSAGIF